MKNTRIKNQKSKTLIKNNNNINLKLNEVQSPQELKLFKKIMQEEIMNFIAFKSIYDFILIVFINKKYSMVSYNLIDYKKIFEIKNVGQYINELKHYLDINNKRDLVSSISLHENNIKIWNYNNLECILNINFNIGNYFLNLNSICFLNNDNNTYLIASSKDMPQTQLIHVYNLRGQKIKEINNNKLKNYFVDTFYDSKFSKNYIIISTNADIRAFDYNENKVVKNFVPVIPENEKPIKVTKYKNVEINRKLGFDDNHVSKFIDYAKGPLYILVKKCGKITKLFAVTKENSIKIWDFHSTQLLCEINIPKLNLRSICLWDDENLLVGTGAGLKLIDLKKNKLVKNFVEIVDIVRMHIYTIPKYGKCLIAQNYKEIYLWINKNLLKK